MVWQHTPYTTPLISMAVVVFVSALYVLQRRHAPSSQTGAFLLLVSAVWIMGYALELASANLPAKLFWQKIQYVGITMLPAVWLAYTLQFTGREKWLTRRILTLASVVLSILLLLISTNEVHGLMWSNAVLDTSGSFAVLRHTEGVGFRVLITCAYTATLLGALLLSNLLIHAHPVYRRQTYVLLSAVIALWLLTAITDIYSFQPISNLELTPFALGLTVSAIAWGLYRLQRADVASVMYKAIFEGTRDGVIVLDAQDCIVNLNTVAQQLIGYTSAKILGQPVAEIWPTDSSQTRETNDELSFPTIDGQYTYEVRNSPLFDWRGNPAGQVIVLHDITVLKQRALELSTVLETSKAVLSTLDLEAVLARIAEEMVKAIRVDGCTLSQWDQESDALITWIAWSRKRLEKSAHPGASYALQGLPATRAVLETRQPAAIHISDPNADPTTITYLRKVKSASLLMLPLVVRDQVIGLVELDQEELERVFTPNEIRLCQALAEQAAVAIENARLFEQAQREIAERRQAEAALEHYAAELERSNRELEQFAHVASHDLQEPLRTVTSYVQLLEMYYKGQLDADADEYIAFIVNGAARMRELVKGLLDYSRVGTDGASFQSTDCQAVLERALANLQTSIEESGATVTHDPLPSVTADATQLARVFQNLISNAIKFRSEQPLQIHVGAERQSRSTWLFLVRDNGIGIEPQYIERIFLIFQRLHNRDEYPGTGIGLAVCKRIVERHGGRIWVESEPGQSSTFYFTLPERR